MNILIITAQPSSKGFVHTMASHYANEIQSPKNTTEIIDLYDKKNILPFLRFEDIKNVNLPRNALALQEKINNADELIFIFPLWWGFMPAILKNFFDTVFSAGFAFQYKNGFPQGLLKGKTAKVFITCDAPRWFYLLFGFPLKKILKNFILKFCGIKVVSFHLWGRISFLSQQKKASILSQIQKSAQK